MQQPLARDESVRSRCRFLFDNAAADRVCRDWVAADMRAAQLSPLFRVYYRLRSLLPLSVRQLLQRYRRVAAWPRWCYGDEFFCMFAKQIAALESELTIIHPWPDDSQFAFVLTHDVESAEGMKRVAAIADLEEEMGFRSSWNFVPHKYLIDTGLMRELTVRGFEIGVHGYNHDGRLFASREIFDRRVPAINAALREWGAVGFRAPMVHRNLDWLQSLEIEYDASCFDADPYQAMPGGVGGVWPFFAGHFVELPYTLPQDHTLFIARHEPNGEIWQDKLDYLQRMHGMSLVITHPDYLDSPNRVEAYRHLLASARESTACWHALPRDVAGWWRDRDALEIRRDAIEQLSIVGRAAGRAKIADVRATPAAICSDLTRSSNRDSQPCLEWHTVVSTRQTICEVAE